MPIQHTNYTLPEFVFLDAQSHEGNLLENRTVIQHIRSYSIIEIIALDEVLIAQFDTKQEDFTYINSFGIEEKHKAVLHFSLAEDFELDEVFEKTINWYREYLTWEDQNIMNDVEN